MDTYRDLETLRQTVDNELLDTIKAYDEKLIEKYEQVLLVFDECGEII